MKKTFLNLTTFSICLFTVSFSFGQSSKDYVTSGTEKYQSYDYNGAINDYTKALKLDSTNVEAYRYRGSIKSFNLKDIKGGCLDWKKAMQLGDNQAKELYTNFCN